MLNGDVFFKRDTVKPDRPIFRSIDQNTFRRDFLMRRLAIVKFKKHALFFQTEESNWNVFADTRIAFFNRCIVYF